MSVSVNSLWQSYSTGYRYVVTGVGYDVLAKHRAVVIYQQLDCDGLLVCPLDRFLVDFHRGYDEVSWLVDTLRHSSADDVVRMRTQFSSSRCMVCWGPRPCYCARAIGG